MLLFFAFGCSSAPAGMPTTLAELDGLDASMYRYADADESWAALRLVWPDDPDNCPLIDDLTASFHGVTADVDEPGEVTGQFSGASFLGLFPGHTYYCAGDSFRWDAPPIEGSEVVLDDGTAQFEFTLESAGEPATLALETPADGVLRPGEDVVLRYSPASDPVEPSDVSILLWGADHDDDATWLEAEVRGDTIIAHLPDELPADVSTIEVETAVGLDITDATEGFEIDFGRGGQASFDVTAE